LLRRRAQTSTAPQALTTAEGILAGLIAGKPRPGAASLESRVTIGSITTLTTNPIWTVQTAQSAHAVIVPKTYAEATDVEKAGTPVEGDNTVRRVKLSAIDAAHAILKKDGLAGFWRGIGPALVLVINPVIQVRGVMRQRHPLMAVHHIRATRRALVDVSTVAQGRHAHSEQDHRAGIPLRLGHVHPWRCVQARRDGYHLPLRERL